MLRNSNALAIVALLCGSASAVAQTERPFMCVMRQDAEGPTIECKSTRDNAVTSFVLNNEGTQNGAVPDGWTQIVLRTQDEVHERGNVLASNDIRGTLRLMSASFGYTPGRGDATGECRNLQCPETLELLSDKHLRLSSGSDGRLELWSRNARTIFLQNGTIFFPKLAALTPESNQNIPYPQQGTRWYLCVDERGMISSAPVCR